jgi:hypothetical protein
MKDDVESGNGADVRTNANASRFVLNLLLPSRLCMDDPAYWKHWSLWVTWWPRASRADFTMGWEAGRDELFKLLLAERKAERNDQAGVSEGSAGRVGDPRR